jgi:hypothetical protein
MIIPETSTSMLKDYLMYNNETVGSLPQERGGDGRGGGGEGIGACPQDLTFYHGVCQFPHCRAKFFWSKYVNFSVPRDSYPLETDQAKHLRNNKKIHSG